MVNTFLTCSPLEKDPITGYSGYRISASKLDFRRLNKQVTEALQILKLIESFYVLAELFQDPIPKNPYDWYDWTRKIMQKYKKLDYYLFFHQGEYVKYKKINPKPLRLAYDENYQVRENGSIFYKGKKYSKYSIVLPDDNFFSLGFWQHPVVVMFLGYSDSLKLYINDHLDEFLHRGGKKSSNKRRCVLEKSIDEIEHPIWALDPKFHFNHKAALLTKEIVRKEKPHYINFKDFVEAYNHYSKISSSIKSKSDFQHYIWVFTHDRNKPLYLI